jgi:hypothetical protein
VILPWGWCTGNESHVENQGKSLRLLFRLEDGKGRHKMISSFQGMIGTDQGVERVLDAGSPPDLKQALGPCTLLVATIDSEMRNSLIELLETYVVNTIWAKSIEEIKSSFIKDKITACFCGFWLVDGTYRDIVRYVKRQHPEMPLVVLCPPTCSQEHQEALAALNIRAFDVIRYPYQRQDVERVLHTALSSHPGQAQMAVSSGGSPHAPFASSGLRRAT